MIRRARSIATLTALALLASAPGVAQTEQTRETWQRVPDLFAAAAVHQGASIADVGSGDGFLTVRLAPAVGPSGKVYAVDSDAKVTDALRTRLAASRITNVEIVLGSEDDPHLPPAALDGAIILNAYHEMRDGIAVLKHLLEALKPGGRLVICEPVRTVPNQSRAAQMDAHVIDPVLVVDDLRTAGFELLQRDDAFATNLGGTPFGLVVARRP